MADFMKTDYSNNSGNSYEPLPTGTYEMIINNAKENATQSGAETLQIDLLVRNDLDKVPELAETNAKYHNRHVFMDNWKRHATNQYDLDGFQYILQAVKVPEGTPLKSIDDFIKLITGAAVSVYVKKEDNTYKGETTKVNRVAPWNFSETKFPDVQHEYKKSSKPAAKQTASSGKDNQADPFANNGDSVDISDDDLPF
ncbi:hypothetical protein IWT140_02222 [Secundilactobacillus pentosiphilus]|uniref:Single-stranded DNA-binding protein n=1 Tax=Secundilactobacillus pentosiphilus TaxID=1714682 RepID=A0A1Z5IS61_9LACO|nr:DUF669 domain-containing protein [Secundilactobacillus pentosiphilus]GAX04580.1 hypothetical protein IWT140_02222 [Secundilactobacillus pentosiphilus]